MNRDNALGGLLIAVALLSSGGARGDATTPAHLPSVPRCHSHAYKVMIDEVVKECATQQASTKTKCDQLLEELRACTARARSRDENGNLIYDIGLGGEWFGAEFAPAHGNWRFKTLVGGDIP